jgi:hypothetical protein
VRLQLELLKPELMMAERGIRSTVVMFGGRADSGARAKGAAPRWPGCRALCSGPANSPA